MTRVERLARIALFSVLYNPLRVLRCVLGCYSPTRVDFNIRPRRTWLERWEWRVDQREIDKRCR